jgi:hypothetical protein
LYKWSDALLNDRLIFACVTTWTCAILGQLARYSIAAFVRTFFVGDRSDA